MNNCNLELTRDLHSSSDWQKLYSDLAQLPIESRGYLRYVLNSFSEKLSKGDLGQIYGFPSREENLTCMFREYWNAQHDNAPQGAAFGLPHYFPTSNEALFIPDDSLEKHFYMFVCTTVNMALTQSTDSYHRPEIGLTNITSRFSVSSN